MTNITTLGEVSKRINDLSRNCIDHQVPVADISFENLETVQIGNQIHRLKPIAQKSISNRLGIPHQYLSKCPEDIQAINLNHWIKHEKNERLFFRFDGPDVRAIFTPRYIPVDNFEVIERLDSLGFGPDTHVQCRLDAEFMAISVIDLDKAFDIQGDKFRPGISVSNSEVGLAALSVSAFVLRLVCTNGLVSKTDLAVSYRHVSARILIDFPRIIENVSSELSRQKHQLKFSMESAVGDPEKTLEAFNHQFQLRKEEIEAVAWAWPYEAGGMMFHIVNAYTRAAQFDGLAAESAYRLQKVGGNILGMVS